MLKLIPLVKTFVLAGSLVPSDMVSILSQLFDTVVFQWGCRSISIVVDMWGLPSHGLETYGVRFVKLSPHTLLERYVLVRFATLVFEAV